MPSSDFTRCPEQSAKDCMLAERSLRWTAEQREGRQYSFMAFSPVTKSGGLCDGFILKEYGRK